MAADFVGPSALPSAQSSVGMWSASKKRLYKQVATKLLPLKRGSRRYGECVFCHGYRLLLRTVDRPVFSRHFVSSLSSFEIIIIRLLLTLQLVVDHVCAFFFLLLKWRTMPKTELGSNHRGACRLVNCVFPTRLARASRADASLPAGVYLSTSIPFCLSCFVGLQQAYSFLSPC